MSFIFKRKINYYETDRMGVVHHSNYIRFLEEARCEMLFVNDMPYSSYESHGIMIPVLGVNLDFKRHVTFDDDIVLTGETKHCFTDMNLRPLNLKKACFDFYEKFEYLKNNK